MKIAKESSKSTTITSSATKAANEAPLKLEVLKQISGELLERTKQLGLFDEIRMRLLAGIEASNGFQRIKSEFKRELDLFISDEADFSMPRAKLRECLNAQTLRKSAQRLKEQVQLISRKHSLELKLLYEAQAVEFLNQLKKQASSSTPELASSSSSSSSSSSLSSFSPCSATRETKNQASNRGLSQEVNEEQPLSATGSLSNDSGFVSNSPPATAAAVVQDGCRRGFIDVITDPKMLDDIPLPDSGSYTRNGSDCSSEWRNRKEVRLKRTRSASSSSSSASSSSSSSSSSASSTRDRYQRSSDSPHDRKRLQYQHERRGSTRTPNRRRRRLNSRGGGRTKPCWFKRASSAGSSGGRRQARATSATIKGCEGAK